MRVMLLALLFACAHVDEADEEIGNVHVAAATSNARLRSDMRAHYEDLRLIDRALRDGRLAEAKALTFWLERLDDRDVSRAAKELASANTLSAALRADAGVAAACGSCHAARDVTARFERDTIVPAIDRHRWGADRIWDGIVGASDMQWRAGLAAIGTRDAERASRHRPSARVYAELLATCVACHPRQR